MASSLSIRRNIMAKYQSEMAAAWRRKKSVMTEKRGEEE